MANQSIPYFNNALTETATNIVTSSCRLDALHAVNNDASTDCWLQLFDAADAGDITVGTTTPTVSLILKAGPGGVDGTYEQPIGFTKGIVAAATSTSTGNSAPASNPTVNLFYTQ